jgi:uncharacterized protein YndB with AHSA1/START domain
LQQSTEGNEIMSMTDDQRTAIDGDAYTVRRSIHISAPIEKVWLTITEPEHISKWFTKAAVLDGAGVGATGIFTFSATDVIPVRIEEIDAPRMITYRWSNDDAAAAKAGGVRPDTIDDAHSLLIRFTLEPIDDGTRLTMVETGFETTIDPTFNLESHRGGWDELLDRLVAHFENES